MELMSSLLLCALVVLLPRSLGVKTAYESEIKVNDAIVIGQNPLNRKKLILGGNFPLVSVHTELQNVFSDLKCTKCIDCMERAIKADKVQMHVSYSAPNKEDLMNNAIESIQQIQSFRDKRDEEKGSEPVTNKTAARKIKMKKNKSISVNKYNVDGKIYALKIKELNTEATAGQHSDTKSFTCQVYNVKKHFPCESAEGALMLAIAKRKANKRNKKITTALTTEKAKPLDSKPAKRQADNTQISDQFMTSIEELY